jgi:hypothetical protein
MLNSVLFLSVYGIDASGMADFARDLVAHNKMSDKIEIIKGTAEEVVLPEKVDIMFVPLTRFVPPAPPLAYRPALL